MGHSARILALFSSLLPFTLPAVANEAAFFQDKQLRLIVGSAAGSGYDVNARLFARYYATHLSQGVNIIVQNQQGAGSVAMANQIYNTVPKDGTVFGAAINGMPNTVPSFGTVL